MIAYLVNDDLTDTIRGIAFRPAVCLPSNLDKFKHSINEFEADPNAGGNGNNSNTFNYLGNVSDLIIVSASIKGAPNTKKILS